MRFKEQTNKEKQTKKIKKKFQTNKQTTHTQTNKLFCYFFFKLKRTPQSVLPINTRN